MHKQNTQQQSMKKQGWKMADVLKIGRERYFQLQ
jgi:hypothetical protein